MKAISGKIATHAVRRMNTVLRLAGAELVRPGPRPFEEFRAYIPLEPTIDAARSSGMSVGDYIDWKHNRPGATKETIDRLRDLGALRPGMRRLCEIGPGSGRYLERTIALCQPERVEIYETATAWRQYLLDRYGVIAHDADGESLSKTSTASIDAVMAHKVFSGTPFLVFCRYLTEMARVVVPGGKVIFDVVTEMCMTPAVLARWLTAGADCQFYPCMTPKLFVVDFLARRGLDFDAGFIVPMEPGLTECLVFTRRVS
jgi:hypothetical protein